jgi:hypothetical protein
MGVIALTRGKWLIALGLLVILGVGCAKPEGTAPARKINTIDIVVSVPKGHPIVTFTVTLELKDAVTGELARHPITNEPAQIKVTRAVREWRGTFTYWGDLPNPVRLSGDVTWPGDDLLNVEIYDNHKLIKVASRFDDTGRIVILYTTSGA